MENLIKMDDLGVPLWKKWSSFKIVGFRPMISVDGFSVGDVYCPRHLWIRKGLRLEDVLWIGWTIRNNQLIIGGWLRWCGTQILE